MQLTDIKNLAKMVRLDMSEEEMQEIGENFDSILSYVGQIQEISNSDIQNNYLLKNVMREDIVTNVPNSYTKSIVENMPHSDGNYLKVKQIL